MKQDRRIIWYKSPLLWAGVTTLVLALYISIRVYLGAWPTVLPVFLFLSVFFLLLIDYRIRVSNLVTSVKYGILIGLSFLVLLSLKILIM